jgi:hypothetical protein
MPASSRIVRRDRVRRCACALVLWLLGLPAPANAEPPPDADPALKPWFEELRQPGTGAPCCSIADCREAIYRIRDGHYEVEILGLWMPVPDNRVIDGEANPTGHAVVCWLPTEGVMCFVRPPGM